MKPLCSLTSKTSRNLLLHTITPGNNQVKVVAHNDSLHLTLAYHRTIRLLYSSI